VTLLHVADIPAEGGYRGTLVALPGIMESANTLLHTARHWASRGFRVLAIDPRGHGASPRWTEDLLRRHPGDVIVEDILATLQQVLTGADKRLVLFGHSAGGAAAAAVAAEHPEGVAAVVLEDPFWRLPVTQFQDRKVAVAASAALRRLKSMSAAERIAEIAALCPQWPPDELPAWSQAKDDMDLALVEDGDIIPTRGWPNLLRDLAEADIPVLVVTGTVRIGITADHRAIIRSLGGEVAVVRGASHFIRRDARDVFHDLVDDFLDRRILPAVREEP